MLEAGRRQEEHRSCLTARILEARRGRMRLPSSLTKRMYTRGGLPPSLTGSIYDGGRRGRQERAYFITD